MAMRLGSVVPDFTADSTAGSMRWHEYIENTWAVLFSHPGDFTPVCTTELGSVAKLMAEFERRGVKVAAISCNDTDSHHAWIEDIEALDQYCGSSKVSYPIVSDPSRDIAELYGMIDPEEKSAEGLPMTCRYEAPPPSPRTGGDPSPHLPTSPPLHARSESFDSVFR